MALRHLTVGLAGALVLTGAVSLATPGTAAAAVQQGIGFNVTPAQPYLHNPDASDWTGSYVVGGQQVWCIDFALAAPDTNQQYQNGTALTTKFGAPVDPTIASEISYLLLRFGNTTSADDAAALAHLLHSWTAAPDATHTTDPANNFMNIAYDVNYHLSRLPASTQQAVATMQADASANHGPWTTSMSAPTGPQTIGTADKWTVNVLNTTAKGLAAVPVNITATDATLPNGKTTQIINTPSDGSGLTVDVTPTGANPKLVATVDSPAAVPMVRVPVGDQNIQKVVTTGGTTQLTSTATTSASTPPGQVTVTKVDANTKAPIVGAQLEFTGADKKNPAMQQNGAPITGSNGKPLVVTTNESGQATVPNVHTPQTVCFVEVTPPPGYDQAFDAASPPTVCANVAPGQNVQLTLTNVPNKIPVAIPAGGAPPTMTAMSSVLNRPAPAALIVFGGLLVVAAGGTGLVVARRRRR
jgi:hypothetical protein